jgi:hypothetical protein
LSLSNRVVPPPATVFLELWRREEAMLQIRWNLRHIETDCSLRPEYEEKTPYRRISPITGTLEPYTPKKILCYRYAITSSAILLLVQVPKPAPTRQYVCGVSGVADGARNIRCHGVRQEYVSVFDKKFFFDYNHYKCWSSCFGFGFNNVSLFYSSF